MLNLLKRIPLLQRKCENIAVRTLFSESVLGLPSYEETRLKIYNDRPKLSEFRFIYEIRKSPVDSLIRATSRYIHIITNKPGELDLLKHSLQRILDEDNSSEPYRFGPLIMRMFHFLNLPMEAIEVKKFQKMLNQSIFDCNNLCFLFFCLFGIFSQFYEEFNSTIFYDKTSFRILLDLLFNNGKYAEVIQLHERYRKQRVSKTVNLHNVITFGACYKLVS